MTNFFPDPGGIFASDMHRHVASCLPLPGSEVLDPLTPEQLLARLNSDALRLSEITDLEAILDDLAKDGDATTSKAEVDGEKGVTVWALTKAGGEKLAGPIANEPPPMEGPRLEAAEAANAALAEEEQQAGIVAAKDRVKRLQGELAEAEEELESANA